MRSSAADDTWVNVGAEGKGVEVGDGDEDAAGADEWVQDEAAGGGLEGEEKMVRNREKD